MVLEEFGKVINYNNNSGIIMSFDGSTLVFTKKDIVSKSLKKGDFVTFVKEEYHFFDFDEKVARFIKVININERK